jgi:hypothetical protein
MKSYELHQECHSMNTGRELGRRGEAELLLTAMIILRMKNKKGEEKTL